jgi:peptide/nickel transport system substrate-binding protein
VRADNSTLTIAWPISPQTFDAVNAPDNPSIWVFVNIYDQLLRPGNDGTSLTPDLATSWDISKDGTVYTFHLRPNVLFHDGTKLTSADVKFCLDRATNPKWLWSYLYSAIKNITTPDPLTVRIQLKHTWAPFLSDVAFFGGAIYPAAYFKKVGVSGISNHPIGSGPYMLQSFQPGVSVTLVKNQKYFAASQYPMQRVVFQVIPNDTSRLVQVEGGQIDVDNVLAPNLVAQVNSSGKATTLVSPSTEITYMQPNHMVAPFGDVNVRQAINHAIERDQIIKTVYLGYARPANSFMARGAIDWDPNIPPPTHDLALAKQYMSKSSVPHGFTMNYEVGAGNIQSNQIAVLFQKEVAPLGITVNIKPVDPTTLANDNQAFKFDFINQYWTNDIPDPDELVSYSVDYTQAVKSYYTQYNNPTLTKLSQLAEVTSDPAKRTQIYYQIQQIFSQQVPFFYIAYIPFLNAVNNHVHGFGENPLGYFILKGVTKS